MEFIVFAKIQKIHHVFSERKQIIKLIGAVRVTAEVEFTTAPLCNAIYTQNVLRLMLGKRGIDLDAAT